MNEDNDDEYTRIDRSELDLPDIDEPLLRACRYADDIADAGTDLSALLTEVNLSLYSVAHVAEQRALRMVLYMSGRGDEIEDPNHSSHCTAIMLSEDERELVKALTALSMDGIVIGWVGAGFSQAA